MKRILSAIVMIPIALLLILEARADVFVGALSIVILLALLEYFNIVKINKFSPSAAILLLSGVTYPFIASGYIKIAGLDIFVLLFLLFSVVAIVAKKDLKDSLNDSAYSILGFLYITYLLSYAVLFKNGSMGPWFLLLICLIVWSNDIFAYYTGRLIGKTKMSPRVSPNKTIEGLAGGLVGGIVVVFVFNHFKDVGFSNAELLVFALMVGVAGVFGDLFESLLKRAGDVKDSGTIIPGHGGVLDRIDSLIFAIPVGWYGLYLPEVF